MIFLGIMLLLRSGERSIFAEFDMRAAFGLASAVSLLTMAALIRVPEKQPVASPAEPPDTPPGSHQADTESAKSHRPGVY